ncbi:MAG: response regulator transcription factor [Bdellovibrionota bacterium]
MEALLAPSLSILIVDNDANFRTGLSAELKKAGCRVAMASGGDRAFALFPEMDFDFIFADIAMPEGSGPELIKHLRALQRPAPVILTSLTLEAKETAFEELGAVAFLKKPFTPQEALDQIKFIRETTRKFTYFLNVRRTLTVVSWMGELSVTQASMLKKCTDEVVAARSKFVILNLHGFTGYDPLLAADIVNFQSKVRNTQAWMLLCGMETRLREKMASKGLVVESEIVDNLQAALQYLVEVGLKG